MFLYNFRHSGILSPYTNPKKQLHNERESKKKKEVIILSINNKKDWFENEILLSRNRDPSPITSHQYHDFIGRLVVVYKKRYTQKVGSTVTKGMKKKIVDFILYFLLSNFIQTVSVFEYWAIANPPFVSWLFFKRKNCSSIIINSNEFKHLKR